MPKHYAVTPVQRPGREVYSANFRTVAQIRVTRSLKTDDEDAAKLICQGLVGLWNAKVRKLDDVPAGTPPESVRLYFEVPDDEEISTGNNIAFSQDLSQLATIKAEADRFPQGKPREQAIVLLMDRYKLRSDVKDLQTKFTILKNEHATLREAHEALTRSVVARVSNSAEGMPEMPGCIDLFEKHLSTTTTRENTKIHVAAARRFVATLPKDVKKLAEVRPEQVGQFLDDETARTKPSKPLARRRNLRIRLARFINWGAKKYDYPSQMRNVEGVRKDPLKRERGEIRWHELTEVEAAINAQDSGYWKALIATLGYAGLQLAELCWLRRSDVEFTETGGKIWVGHVTDPTDPKAKHSLKTGNRERHVDVHPTYLLPRLREYLATVPAGEVYFFPMPEEHRRRQRTGGGHSERWHTHTLSTQLRGHKGGKGAKGQKKRPPHAGKLPKGMTAATLRHTFGSLLLRSKHAKSYAQVAAAMGNSETVVAEYYARLKGGETKVDF